MLGSHLVMVTAKNSKRERDRQYEKAGRHSHAAAALGPVLHAQIDFKNGKRHQVLGEREECEERPRMWPDRNRKGAIEEQREEYRCSMNKDALTTRYRPQRPPAMSLEVPGQGIAQR